MLVARFSAINGIYLLFYAIESLLSRVLFEYLTLQSLEIFSLGTNLLDYLTIIIRDFAGIASSSYEI